jgi:hypothetical protein
VHECDTCSLPPLLDFKMPRNRTLSRSAPFGTVERAGFSRLPGAGGVQPPARPGPDTRTSSHFGINAPRWMARVGGRRRCGTEAGGSVSRTSAGYRHGGRGRNLKSWPARNGGATAHAVDQSRAPTVPRRPTPNGSARGVLGETATEVRAMGVSFSRRVRACRARGSAPNTSCVVTRAKHANLELGVSRIA